MRKNVLLVGLAMAVVATAVERAHGSPRQRATPAQVTCTPVDEHDLAAYATDIFVGRVLLVRTGDGFQPPWYLADGFIDAVYVVEVTRTVKGAASGTVEVLEEGFFAPCWERPRDEVTLKPDDLALFVTTFVPGQRRYGMLLGGRANVVITDLQRKEELVTRFMALLGTPVAERATPTASTPVALHADNAETGR